MLMFFLFILLTLGFSNAAYSDNCTGKVIQVRSDGHATYFTYKLQDGRDFRQFLCGKDQNGTIFSCDGRMGIIFWALAEDRPVTVTRPNSMGCHANTNYNMPFVVDIN